MIDDICCRLFSAGWSFVIFVLFSLFFFSFFHRIDELGAAPLRDGIFIISSHLFYFIGFFSPLLPSFLPSFLPIETKKNGFFLVVVVDCVMILRLKKFLILLFKYILNSVSVDGWKGRPWAPSPVECSFHRWFDSICGCGGGRTDGSTGCISTWIGFFYQLQWWNRAVCLMRIWFSDFPKPISIFSNDNWSLGWGNWLELATVVVGRQVWNEMETMNGK